MQICLSIAQQMDSVSDWKKAAEDKSELDSSGSIYQSGDIEEIIAIAYYAWIPCLIYNSPPFSVFP